MLHTVNKSPFTTTSLEECISYAAAKDSILLYEDAVLGVQKGSKVEALIQEAMKSCTVCALEEDLNARGITNIIDGIQKVNYGGFVDLVEKENTVSPWL